MHKQHYLLCYDISEPKRLQRVQRLVSKQMLQIQYSIYYATLYQKEIDKLIGAVSKLINRHYDDVRVYEVEPLENAFLIGKRSSDIMLFSGEGKRIYW